MKILFLADNFPPEANNGPANRVFERASYWVKWGHQVTVITSVPNFPEGKVHTGYKNKLYQEEYLEGIRVIRVITFISPNKGFALRILDFLSYMFSSFIAGIFQKKPDIVIATTPQFFAGISGLALAKIKKVPFIHEISDLWPASILAVGAMKKGKLIRGLEKLELFLYRHSAAIVSLTQAYKENLISRGICQEKISVINNGVDLARHIIAPRNEILASQFNLRNVFTIAYLVA